jgi:hypothetical protein
MAHCNLQHYYTAMVVTAMVVRPAIAFRRCAILFLSVAAMPLSACHQSRPAGDPTRADPLIEVQGEIAVHVINRNWIDVMVYVSHGGVRTRLGLAVASTTTDFSVPLRLLGAGREYRLQGHPVGVPTEISTETLVGQPGDNVTWQLEPVFAQSTVVVH